MAATLALISVPPGAAVAGPSPEAGQGASAATRGKAPQSRLDRYPAHVWATMARAREAEIARTGLPARGVRLASAAPVAAPVTAVFLPDTKWRKPVITVAFNGGHSRLHALIERTIREWTRNGRALRLSFRKADGRFRTWSETDAQPSADIRITFGGDGYWSLIGRFAQHELAGKPTMGLVDFETLPARLLAGGKAWRSSYEQAVVLHEFGHALGFAHEQFHPSCQADLKLDPDPGYQTELNQDGEYVPDPSDRSPGALLYFQGPPYKMKDAQFNLDASVYRRLTLLDIERYFHVSNPRIVTSRAIDNRSVMLYWFRPYLLAGGAGSPCRVIGDGQIGEERFATRLSRGDRRFYRRYYR